jgi:hypothetical protein
MLSSQVRSPMPLKPVPSLTLKQLLLQSNAAELRSREALQELRKEVRSPMPPGRLDLSLKSCCLLLQVHSYDLDVRMGLTAVQHNLAGWKEAVRHMHRVWARMPASRRPLPLPTAPVTALPSLSASCSILLTLPMLNWTPRPALLASGSHAA